MILEQIHKSSDIKCLNIQQTRQLCAELRSFLIDSVSHTGGHLASNLGAVELTVAIHRVFDTDVDRLVFDVGHQCYIHKMLTGRWEEFSTLRQWGGISGFPKPKESSSDAFLAGHASNSVSVALGMARARTLQNKDYKVLALIGDGALTGGLAYEGLNDAGASGEPLIVILNDNGMSIDCNVGAISKHLAKLRIKPGYYRLKKIYHKALRGSAAGQAVYRFNHRIKTAMKKNLFPSSSLFEDMGFTYLGPVDGHDVEQMVTALEWARDLACPVLLHVQTKKGKGYLPAEQHPNYYHSVKPFDRQKGIESPGDEQDFSYMFGQSLCLLAQKDPRICAITAAMEDGTGLREFAGRFPERFFDVGIAEGHAASMAAGMAQQGMRPVFAVYSTFLQRSYDMLIHDIALSGAPVVLAVDRAGLVGADGETHQGIFDVAYLTQLPGMKVLSPANYQELRGMLEYALQQNGPVAVRYPRGKEGEYRLPWDRSGAQVLRSGRDITLVGYGALVENLLQAAKFLEKKNISAEVVKLHCIAPLETEVLRASLTRTGRLLVAEDCIENGCIGQQILAWAAQNHISLNMAVLKNLGAHFPSHGQVSQLQQQYGLDGKGLAQAVAEEWK